VSVRRDDRQRGKCSAGTFSVAGRTVILNPLLEEGKGRTNAEFAKKSIERLKEGRGFTPITVLRLFHLAVRKGGGKGTSAGRIILSLKCERGGKQAVAGPCTRR